MAPVPPRADIYIDDTFWAAFGPGTQTIELDWSRDHVVVFKNPCCSEARFEVGPNKEPLRDNRIAVRFKGLPARLTVETEPPSEGKVGILEILDAEDDGSHVRVEIVDELGSPLPIRFEGDSDMRKQLKLTVQAKGKPPRNHTVEIHAGEKLVKKVPLND